MKNYDIAFSLGSVCGMSQSLRAAGLQFASYPFDWLGSLDPLMGASSIMNDFDHWLEFNDMRLVEVSHDVGFCTRIYLNERTGFGFSHEFSDFEPFSVTFPKIKNSYQRRIDRFLETLRTSDRILAVYLEIPAAARAQDSVLTKTVDMLRKKFPAAQVDLLYIYEDPGSSKPRVVHDADGIMIAVADYRVVEDGRVTQYVKIPVLRDFLKSFLTVPDKRTDEQKQKFSEEARLLKTLRWGPDKTPLRRWWNHRMYKLYRHMERYLRRNGVIHPARPIWFWSDDWLRSHGRKK